jgi:hypothetical protein
VPPPAQRDQFDILITAINDSAQQYRSAQTALSSGNADAYQAALNQADRTMTKASTAAQRYGMPPLADCAKVAGGPQQNPASAQPAGWVLGHDSPLAVQQVGAAVLDGRIWVAGGLTGPESATTRTEFHDPTIDVWSPGQALPVPLHHAMMVSYRNTVWVIGGFEPQGSDVSGVASARVLHLNQAQDSWIDGPELDHGRAAGAAAVVGNKIVVVGGRTVGNSAGPVTYRGFRRHQLARRRRHSDSGRSPGGRVGRDVPVRRRWAQIRGHHQYCGGAALRPSGRPVDPAAGHAEPWQRLRPAVCAVASHYSLYFVI